MKNNNYQNNYNHQTKIRYKTSANDAKILLQNIEDKQLQKFLAWTRISKNGITEYEEYLFHYKGDLVLPAPPTAEMSRDQILKELVEWLERKGTRLDDHYIKRIADFNSKSLE